MMYRMGMRMGVLLAAVALVGAAWARLPADPYGVCSHITRNWAGEWTDRDVLFKEMKRAGISWIRADIDADSAMPKNGQFNDDYIRRALAPSAAPKAAFDIVGKSVAVPDFARPVKLTTTPFYLLGGEVAFAGK